MVKTLPTVERSTQIRFGKHAQQDQGENTIVLNASNTAVDASNGGAVYVSPVRFDDTYEGKAEIVLMMYNTETKELTQSGESAQDVIGNQGLQAVTNQGNVTSNSLIFYNNTVAFATTGNVGISNALASHTLSVGSNLYVDDYGTNVLVVSGGVGITNTTTSTSATTGALKVAGGISTEENLNVGAVTKVLSATDSTSKTTGALIVTGGVGISKNIHGKNVFVEDVVSNSVAVLDTTDATSKTTGTLTVAGGIGVAKNIHGKNVFVEDVVSNSVVILDNTTSTSDTTGALQVVGGISTQENLNVGAVAKVLSATDASSKTTGALIVTGGLGVAKNIHGKNVFVEDVVSNSVVILDTTTSDSATTGALKVVGGISTQENLNVGAVAKVISATDATSKTTGALIVTGGLGVAKNIHGKNVFVEDVVSNSVVILDTTTSTSATTGALKVVGGISTQENLNVGAVAKVISGTDATSKTTGALIVTGGVGISKNIHALNANFEDVEADSVDITDTTLSYNQTTGALKVAGGLGVAGNVHCGNLTLTGNLVVTGNTTVINANNLVVQDPIIELGKGNLAGLDTGILMNNPLTSGNKGNVAVIYDFSTSNLEIGHTLSSANNSPVIMNTSNAIAVNINGTLGVTSTTASSSKTTGAVTIGGGLGVVGDIHATHANLEDVEADSVTITDNTTSTSATTGALKVVGGISTQENLNVGAVAKVISATDASSKTTGALIVTGGVGISKNIHALHANFEDVEADSVTITDNTTSSSATTGALKVVGGISTQENLNVGAVAKVLSATDASSKTTGALIVSGGVGISKNIHALHANFEDVEADSVTITDTTTSTSTTTGALKVAGGISTQENLSVGGDVLVVDTTAGSAAGPEVELFRNITGADGNYLGQVKFQGNNDADAQKNYAKITGKIGDASDGTEDGLIEFATIKAGSQSIRARLTSTNLKLLNDAGIEVDGTADITNTTGSTSTTTGALKVAGGISTQEKLNVGGITKIWDATDASSKTTGAVQIVGGLGVSKNIHGKDVFVEDVVSNSVVILDTTTSTSATTGALKVAGGISTQENLNVGAVAKVISATDASSKTTGALIVTGGVGISKNIHALHANFEDVEADSVTITDNTTSDSATTGALKVVGGISTQENLNVGAVAKVISATDATSKTTGALIVTGGLGVAKNIHGKNVFVEDVVSNSVVILDTTDASSKTTGALKVSGGLGVAGNVHSSNIFAGYDLDLTSYMGRAAVGFAGETNHASFAHVDNNTSGNYALKQTEGGTTHVNAKAGQHIRLNINNSEKARVTGAGDLKVGSNVLYVDVSETSIGVNTASPEAKLHVVGNAYVSSTTDATTTTTGALIVAGGLGIAKKIVGQHANFEDVEADSVTVTDTTASDGKTAGALIVAGGVGVSGALFGAAATLDGVVTLTDTTEATSSTTGALKAAGGVGIAKDVYVGERAYVTGGLITNTGGLGRKTYSLSNSMPASVSPTTNIHFTSNIFYAKITATLVDRNEHVSTILLDVNGGSQAGSINSGSNVISVGNQTIFGTTDNATPWASNVSTTANTVALYTSGAMAVSGNVHVFVEYMSPTSGGGVHAIAHNGDTLATFGY